MSSNNTQPFSTLHIAFTGNNYVDSQECIDDLNEKLYKKFRIDYEKNLENKLPKYLYNPDIYVMFGSSDFCFLSLIDDLEFAQKNFSTEQFQKLFTSTQLTTGLPKHLVIKETKEENSINYHKKAFLGVINLKIKNGFLIGNGNDFLNPVIDKLKSTIEDYKIKNKFSDINLDESIILQSFSWFEITIVVFSDVLDYIQELVREFRKLKFSNVIEENSREHIINNSLYGLNKEDVSHLYEKGIFSDSQTFLGIKKEIIDCDDENSLSKFNEIIEIKENKKINLQIDVQIKPSNIKYFRKLLGLEDDKFDFFITGKYDFTTHIIKDNSLLTFKKIYKDTQSKVIDLHKIIRKLQTNILLDVEKDSEPSNGCNFSITDFTNKLVINKDDIKEALEKLRCMKISRQIRKKILKTFENFNEVIDDPILFIYFIDTRQFLADFINIIFADYKEYTSKLINKDVIKLEENYKRYIEVFENAYHSRTVNSSRIENFSNYDIDYNSSIEQLLTSYNTVYTAFGDLFYKRGDKGKILLTNSDNTISQGHFVNFFIYHLVTPEFTYVTFLKELLNAYLFQNAIVGSFDDAFLDFKKNCHELKNFVKESDELSKFISIDDKNIDNDKFDLYQYFILDYFRLLIVFKDYNLFEFWFWEFNFQNQRLFSIDGCISKGQFKNEMRRLFFLAALCGRDLKDIECPLPELHNYWIRYRSNIIDWIENNDCSNLVKKIKKITENHWNELSRNVSDIPPNDLSRIVFEEINAQTDYLNKVYELFKNSNYKIKYLRRDWSNGSVNDIFLFRNDKYPYYVDQFGGIFYDNQKMKNIHHKIRIDEFIRIWDSSLKIKKNLINLYIKRAMN